MRWKLLSLFLLWVFALISPAQAELYRPVVAILSFQGPKDIQKDVQSLRQEVYTILEADERLQVFSASAFEAKAKEYGYSAQDIFGGDGVQIVARDTEHDGILVGKVQKLGAKFELTLRVYDGGTGLGLLTKTFLLPGLKLRQGEKEEIAKEVADALSESRITLTNPTPQPKPKPTKEEEPPKLSRKEKRQQEKEAAAAKKAEQEKIRASKEEEPEPTTKPTKPKKEKKPKEEPTEEAPTEDAPLFGKVSIAAGPALLGRFSAIQAVDANGVALANFEPTLYAAPAYGGANARIAIAPVELFAPTGKEPYLLLEGSFARSFGLASNLDGQAITTTAQELSAAATLRVDMGAPVLALRGAFTSYAFAFVLGADQAAVQDQLAALGLVNLNYKLLGFGPELQIPVKNGAAVVMMGAEFHSVFNAGQLAQDGYGLVDTSFGGQAKLGARFRVKENFSLETSLMGRLWAVNYEGGGVLLEGETIETRDKLFGILVSAGYMSK
jgi:hypothetical protein